MSTNASIPRDLVVSGTVPIHARIHPGSGPALVLIHGISSSGDVWLPVLEALGERFTPVTFDLRGHGASGKPDRGYLYGDYIGDLDRLLAALGLDRPLILGHSLGGLIALWWAAKQPDRAAAMVIEDSPLRSGEDFRHAFDNWIRLNAMSKDELRAAYAAEHPGWKPAALDLRTEQMHAAAPPVFAELKADSMAHDGVDRIAEIDGIVSPVLLIHGDIDAGGMVHEEDAEAVASRLANATAARIPGGNHGLHVEHTRAFLALAVPFLEQHAAEASHIDIDEP
jgi:pimeloyl-ACP methyl ester carboxylesterase